MSTVSIEGGRVVDPANGTDAIRTVLIDGSRVSGDRSLRPQLRIDATDLLVTAGFVDFHTHTDFTLPLDPRAEARLRQGVTTDVTGNCGFSPFPLTPEHTAHGRFIEPDLVERWPDLSAFADALTDSCPAINVAPLVGLGAVRLAVMGEEDRRPTSAELKAMRALVDVAMKQGAFGASSGLVYVPSKFAGVEELAFVLDPVARRDGVYATHLRDERDGVVEAVQEAIDTMRRAGLRKLQISHHKAIGQRNWGAIEHSLQLIDDQNSRQDVAVAVDVYPYTAGSTTISSLLPTHAIVGGLDRLGDRVIDPSFERSILEYLGSAAQFRLDEVRLGECRSRPGLSGSLLVESARNLGVEPERLALDLIIAEGESLTMVAEAASAIDLRHACSHSSAMHGSDAWVLSEDRTAFAHPRNFESTLRLLKLAETGAIGIDISTAIDMLTAKPAARLGLIGRGDLAQGAVADIAVIDLSCIDERPDYENPCRYPDAVRWLFVAGVAVIANGERTGARPGRVLAAGAPGGQS